MLIFILSAVCSTKIIHVLLITSYDNVLAKEIKNGFAIISGIVKYKLCVLFVELKSNLVIM